MQQNNVRFLPGTAIYEEYMYMCNVHVHVHTVYIVSCISPHVTLHTHIHVYTQYQVQEASVRERAVQERARAIDEQK